MCGFGVLVLVLRGVRLGFPNWGRVGGNLVETGGRLTDIGSELPCPLPHMYRWLVRKLRETWL